MLKLKFEKNGKKKEKEFYSFYEAIREKNALRAEGVSAKLIDTNYRSDEPLKVVKKRRTSISENEKQKIQNCIARLQHLRSPDKKVPKKDEPLINTKHLTSDRGHW